MNPNELLRIVDSLHRDKNIDPEIVFQAIEAALVTAAKRQFGDDEEITVSINRADGTLTASRHGEPMDQETIGRIGAQTAKQVIIQKIREAERDSLIEEFDQQVGQMVSGIVQRNEGGAATVQLANLEAILPRSEMIPGESHHPNERIRAVVAEVRAVGSRVRVVLSRTRGHLVQRLFEQEIPEIADGVIQIRALAREPGYRSKVAVSSTDSRVDCVGACVGVRGNRIKNIVDELAGERIDIVRWDDNPEVLIPNALQPAEVDQVLLCDMIGRAIVLVREDQLSLAIGRRGQNVRLASKLCGWDIEIMTADELEEQIEGAVEGFSEIEGVTPELAQSLVEQGYLSYDDLEVIEPDALMEMGGLTAEQVDAIVAEAEKRAEESDRHAPEERDRQRKAERAAQQQAASAPVDAEPSADTDAADTEAADAKVADTESPSGVPASVETQPAADASPEDGAAEGLEDSVGPEQSFRQPDEIEAESTEQPAAPQQAATTPEDPEDPTEEKTREVASSDGTQQQDAASSTEDADAAEQAGDSEEVPRRSEEEEEDSGVESPVQQDDESGIRSN